MKKVILVLACGALAVLVGCKQPAGEKQPPQPAASADRISAEDAATSEAAPSPKSDTAATAGGDTQAVQPSATELQITDTEVGAGAVAEAGKLVTVHYRGTLTNGKEFDASRNHGRPFTFRLGAGQVIPGWDEGLQGMKVGGKRKLVIPPSMGYGAEGAGDDIPPNATLVFEVELLEVE